MRKEEGIPLETVMPAFRGVLLYAERQYGKANGRTLWKTLTVVNNIPMRTPIPWGLSWTFRKWLTPCCDWVERVMSALILRNDVLHSPVVCGGVLSVTG